MKATDMLFLTKKLDMILQEIDDIKYNIVELALLNYKKEKEENDES